MTAVEAPARPRTVGRSLPLRGAAEAVTGQLRFLTDLVLPDMVYGAVVRASSAHARVQAIDPDPARRVPGVLAVLTARDVPQNRLEHWPVLVEDRVRRVGDAIALVAGVSPTAAAAGARAVRVDLDPLPVLSDPERALEPDAPQLYPTGNLVSEVAHEQGDVERALGAADVLVERVVWLPAQEHVCLETGGGVGSCQDGRFTIWCGTQHPDVTRRDVAIAMQVGEEDVRVISTPMGGAFGSKGEDSLAIHLAVLAQATNRPVRIMLTREEVMTAGVKRHSGRIRTRLGLDRSGRMIALDTDALLDTGPYPSQGPYVLKVGAELSTGAYRFSAARFRGRVVHSNNANGGAFRGYGAPQVIFALETAVDAAGARLDLDPLEIRRRNVLHPGDAHPLYGHPVDAGLRAAEALETAAAQQIWVDREQWRRSAAGPWRRGTGLALAMKGVGMGSARGDVARARIELTGPGRVRLWVGPNHSGQAIDTAYAQVAADALGLPYEDVEVVIGDTETVADSGGCAASRSTYAGGSAVQRACQELLTRIGSPGDGPVDWERAYRALREQGATVAQVTFQFPDVSPSAGITPETITGFSPHAVYSSAAQIVRLEVNEHTGETRVPSMVCAVDCGRAVNPAAVIGQTEGGIVQGLGYALMEEHLLVDGIPRTTGLETYLIPTAVDVPRIETLLVESDQGSGPFGAKGIAEVVLVPTAPAVAAGIQDAVGILPARLPMTAERLYHELGGSVAPGDTQ